MTGRGISFTVFHYDVLDVDLVLSRGLTMEK